MLDTDTLLMKRALELARKGAGLASPNPMVGAMLVNAGRIVGEGYHRYDRVKHAEAYAIEAAGKRARGATAYLTLEPCSHHGRTPPCVDALIRAGIDRAVIAVRDLNPRVDGRGIDALRHAGIDVEIGVLEDHALRLNESYFKFITTAKPFVHAVIVYGNHAATREWQPSNEFLRAVSEYDALMIGNRLELAQATAAAFAGRERHRPLVLASDKQDPKLLEEVKKAIAVEVSVVGFDKTPRSSAGSPAKVVRLEEGIGHGMALSQFGLLLVTLGRAQVSSLLSLPGVFDPGDPAVFEEFDKLTLVVPNQADGRAVAALWSVGDIEFDLEETITVEANGFMEVTGYPSARGVA